MDWVKEALFIGAIAYAYQEVTKQKILDNSNLKYATLGGVLGLLVGPRIEQYIKNDAELTQDMKNKLLGAGIGAVGGYALGDRVAGQAKKSFGGLEKKLK
jgi:predicted aconitase